MNEMDAALVPPLRYGVLLDSSKVNGWQAAVLEHLQSSGDAELALLVVRSGTSRGASTERRRPALRRSLSERAGTALFRAYSTRLSRPRALRASPVAPWPQTIPAVRVSPARDDRAALVLCSEDIEAINAHALDFLIGFGFDGLGGAALGCARLGVWTFLAGDGHPGNAQPPGLWPIVDGQATIDVVLRRLTDGPDLVSLRAGTFAVAPESYALTRDRLLLGCAAWPALVCRDIRSGTARTPERVLSSTAADPRRALAMGPAVRFLANTTLARLRKYWHHGLKHDDWNIGIVDAPVEAILARRSLPPVQWAPTRKGHYAADPFGRWDGERLEVFYEDFSRARGFGSIAGRRWSRGRGWEAGGPVLEIGSHLSYPFVLEHEGRRLMLPESRASGRLTLYEADGVATWRGSAELSLGVDVADATILRHDGRWWLFGARADRLNPATELFLWFADRPEGPWRQHPLNPVVVDVRSARPAGQLFRVDGQLYRPAQDCSTGYGDRLAVKRVVTLTADCYEEELVCFLDAARNGPYPCGLHTLTAMGEVTLVDGKRWAWSTTSTVRAIRRRLHA